MGTKLAALLTLAVTACSAGHAAEAPNPSTPPRVLVEALLFDAPPGGLAEIGGNPASASFGDVIKRAGAHHVSSPHALIADGVVTRMSLPAEAPAPSSANADALAGYRLDVTPHVVEGGRVRLGVDLDIGGKKAATTMVVDDKQLIVLGTDVAIEDRRVLLLVRPIIVRNDADLEAIMKAKTAAN